MRVFAYLYSDPLLESAPDRHCWGWEVDRVYQDLGDRTALAQLFSQCEDRVPTCVLVRRLEELGETAMAVGEAIASLEAFNVKLIATEQSDIGVRANLVQLLSEVQLRLQQRRLRRGHARNRLQALPPPGKAPYGYRRGQERYLVDRSTAPLIEDFVERFLLFGSLRGAVRYLEQQFGKKISVSTGQRWLTHPVYRGHLAYRNGETIPNTHVAIIPPEQAAQIDRLLRRNRRLPPRSASAPRSLAGLVVCQQCQQSLKVARTTQRGKKREYLYLRSPQCPYEPKCCALSYQAVLEQTIQRICEDLPLAVAAMDSPPQQNAKTKLQDEAQRLQSTLKRLDDLETEGILDAETAALRRYKLQTEYATLERELAQQPPENLKAIADAVSLPQFWFDLSESERRFYFREFLQQIRLIRGGDRCWRLELVFFF